MSRRTWTSGAAAVVVATMIAAACSSGSGKPAPQTTTTSTTLPTPTRQVAIDPIFVASDPTGNSRGETEPIQVRIRPSSDGKLRVTFAEHAVGGTGDQWKAAGWSAVAAATLLTGAPLTNREIDFTVTGRLESPSAGALMTIAVIALIRGDTLQPDITMTGTINPDGTIGPVRGIPYEVDGAVAAHKTRLLVPQGEGRAPDDTGRLIDVVVKGRQQGIQVSETPSIYDAYPHFTGKTLPQLAPSTNTRLDASVYDKIKARVGAWLAKYDAAFQGFLGLAPAVRQDLEPYAAAAVQDATQAKKLTTQGLQAGAFAEAVNASALMDATARTGQLFPVLLTGGAQPFVAKIKSIRSVPDELSSLVKALGSFAPRTVGDAGALNAGYGSAIDALSFSQLAQHLFDAPAGNPQEALAQVAQGAVYYELAGALVDAASDVVAVGQGLGGAALGSNLDTSDVAAFFREAAEANLQAFQSLVIAPAAAAEKLSLSSAESVLAAADTTYALAETGDGILRALPSYFGRGATAGEAELGGAISLYVRTAQLLAKYSSLGQVDPRTLELTGVANVSAFNSAIERGEAQLAANIGSLRAQNVNPLVAAADNEVASVEQNGKVGDQFDALGDYWDGYVNCRVLVYQGGFPAP